MATQVPSRVVIPATQQTEGGPASYILLCTTDDGTQYAVEKRYSRASNFLCDPSRARSMHRRSLGTDTFLVGLHRQSSTFFAPI